MSIETESELLGLQQAGTVVARALAAMEAHACAGITTAELDDIARKVLDDHGARPTPEHTLNFPGASCISINDEAVHGIPGPRQLQSGDIVKIDVTADLDCFVADAARTILIGAHHLATRLAECARAAFNQAMHNATSRRSTVDIGYAIDRETRRHGFRVIKQLCGHGVGREMHEPPSVPNYHEPRMAHPLTEGLVITIEPIICAGSGQVYQAKDGWTVRTSDRSLAAHYEDTVVITRGLPMNLTAAS